MHSVVISLGSRLDSFLGSQTMSDIRDAFLQIRPQLFSGQRPFKFHYYNISTFVHPDREWPEDRKKSFRKCKHTLVAVDETTEPVSQSVYMTQVRTFVHHLLTLSHDPTFPIWFFSVNEPAMTASNCHSPNPARTTNHPCNDALKGLMNDFPPQVHFLDNTDLVSPQFDANRDDIIAVIALRIYVLVGKGVSDWRAIGQKGLIDGLHRNGTVEPNFELVPYEGW